MSEELPEAVQELDEHQQEALVNLIDSRKTAEGASKDSPA